MLRGLCLSSVKKMAGTKGKKPSPQCWPCRGGGGGRSVWCGVCETGALPLQMDTLCSPNTESWWRSPILFTIPNFGGWVLPQTTPHIAPPGLLQVLGSPGEQALAAAQKGSSQLETVNSSPQLRWMSSAPWKCHHLNRA